MMSDLRIAWAPFAHPDAPHGYGIIAKRLREALTLAGGNVLGSLALSWDCVVAVSLPAGWAVTQQGRKDMVWHTMFEAEPLPPGWADVLNRTAGVWVPSQWCQDLFASSGVKVPIFVGGYGVDHSIYYTRAAKPRDGRFKVLVWSQALVGRKNALMALRAFQECGFHPDDAEIEIKVNINQADARVLDVDGKVIPNARVWADDWPASRVAEWLRSGDVLVYLSGGEGFGLMPLEAMACGVPVICAYNTGMTEYLTPDNAMLVRSEGKVKNIGYTLQHGNGAELYIEKPSQKEAAYHLCWAFDNREEAEAIGRRGAETAKLWTWERAGVKALAELTTLFGAPSAITNS